MISRVRTGRSDVPFVSCEVVALMVIVRKAFLGALSGRVVRVLGALLKLCRRVSRKEARAEYKEVKDENGRATTCMKTFLTMGKCRKRSSPSEQEVRERWQRVIGYVSDVRSIQARQTPAVQGLQALHGFYMLIRDNCCECHCCRGTRYNKKAFTPAYDNFMTSTPRILPLPTSAACVSCRALVLI